MWDYILFTVGLLIVIFILITCLCATDHFNAKRKKHVRFQMDEENSSAMSSMDLLVSPL